MIKKYIYFVGKPYNQENARTLIRRNGYHVGLLHDKNVAIHNPEAYDDIIEVDFSSQRAIFDSLASKNLAVSGLICTYENYIVAKSQLAKHFDLPSQSQSSAEISTDKYLMRQSFIQADPSITPRFGLVKTEDEVLRLSRKLGYPLIIKPTNLVKSLLVLRSNSEAELLSNYNYAQEHIAELYKKYKIYDRLPQLIIEEYIIGQTCSIAAFVDRHGTPHFCEGIATLINAQDKGINDNYISSRILGKQFNGDLAANLYETARKGIVALNMTSVPAHVELIYNDEGVKLIEIGARIGGYRPRMYNLSYGVDLFDQEIKLALGQQPNLTANFTNYSAVLELFPAVKGVFKSVVGAVDTTQFSSYSVKVKAGDNIGPAKHGYKAAVIIIVSSADYEEFKKLCADVDNLQIVVM